MTPHDFDEILGINQDDITKTNTNIRDSITVNIKLATIIHFFAISDATLFCLFFSALRFFVAFFINYRTDIP